MRVSLGDHIALGARVGASAAAIPADPILGFAQSNRTSHTEAQTCPLLPNVTVQADAADFCRDLSIS